MFVELIESCTKLYLRMLKCVGFKFPSTYLSLAILINELIKMILILTLKRRKLCGILYERCVYIYVCRLNSMLRASRYIKIDGKSLTLPPGLMEIEQAQAVESITRRSRVVRHSPSMCLFERVYWLVIYLTCRLWTTLYILVIIPLNYFRVLIVSVSTALISTSEKWYQSQLFSLNHTS